mmetsp:Transcript_1695/g.3534  ORF Transcript_1695/g.3534 Transcript_1695/m.3534 type:complete len:86 (-) Transcript_1695:528-785(-)
MEEKKECPQCRCAVTSNPVPTPTIDHIIEAVWEFIDDKARIDLKKRRHHQKFSFAAHDNSVGWSYSPKDATFEPLEPLSESDDDE